MKIPAATVLASATITTALVLPQMNLPFQHDAAPSAAPSPSSIPQTPMHTTDLMAGKAWQPTPISTARAAPTATHLPTSAPTSSTPPGEWQDL